MKFFLYLALMASFFDFLMSWFQNYDTNKFQILRDNFEYIRDVYYQEHNALERQHDGKRFYYEVKNFPRIQELIDKIPGIKKNSGRIYVMDFPMFIRPKKERMSRWVRYELVLRGGRGCVFETWKHRKMLPDGSDVIYDPSFSHRYLKRSIFTRLSLVVDVDRFTV